MSAKAWKLKGSCLLRCDPARLTSSLAYRPVQRPMLQLACPGAVARYLTCANLHVSTSLAEQAASCRFSEHRIASFTRRLTFTELTMLSQSVACLSHASQETWHKHTRNTPCTPLDSIMLLRSRAAVME